jgi:predicted dehydrogenase
MRGGIIGFGNIAEKGHLPAYRSLGVDVVAVADVCPERRRRARLSGLKSYSTPEELLEEEELDFVDLCTPPNYRLQAINLASIAGVDVLCEKPIAHPWELEEVRRAVLGSDIFFFPVHNWKYSPHYRKMKELINGKGDIFMETRRTGYSRGNEAWNPDWRVDPRISGGGILMDHGYHNIYLAMYLMGSEFGRAKLHSISYFGDTGVDCDVEFELEFPEGRRAMVSLTWTSLKREVNIQCSSPRKIELLENRLTCGDRVYEFREGLSKDSVHADWFRGVIRDFISLRKIGGRTYFQEALKVLEGVRELYRQSPKPVGPRSRCRA